MPINFPGVPTREGRTGEVWTRDALHDDYDWEAGGGGPGPTGDVSYVHNQSVTSSVWIIIHDLGWYPNVMVIDSAGTQVEGDVTQTSSTIMTIQFSAAFTGIAYVS
jgi:hypothetical protein